MSARYPATVMVSCTVPWDARDEIDVPRFRAQAAAARAAGLRPMYVIGTAGEGYAVDTRRFTEVCRLFREETADPGIHAMVGVIALSTATVIERVRIAHDLGFRAFQLSLPRWDVLRDAEVERFFREVCGAFPDAVFMHYNTGRVGRILGADHYRRWIADVPNLVATKTMTADITLVGRLVAEVPDLMHFVSEPIYPYARQRGPCAILGTWALLAPERSWALFHAGAEGRTAEAVAHGAWFTRLNEEVFAEAMADARIDGTYDKAIVRLRAVPDFPLRMLSPYLCLDDAEVDGTAAAVLRARFPDCR
ncbi:MAG: dihydrodipicolinate synthase family protein [Chloroflexota bacterium]